MTKEEYLEILDKAARYKALEKKELNLKEAKNRLKGVADITLENQYGYFKLKEALPELNEAIREAAINIINKQLCEVVEDMNNL